MINKLIQTKTVAKHGEGNCLETCYAMLFNLNIEDIPPFKGDNWFLECQYFLQNKGYILLNIYPSSSIWPFSNKSKTPYMSSVTDLALYTLNDFVILSGWGGRLRNTGEKIYHSVLYNVITEEIIDPHPENLGILEPMYLTIFEKNIATI